MSTATIGRSREYDGETWRQVEGLPGYEVSSEGRMRSWIPWKGTALPRILKPSANVDGYLVVRPRNPAGKRTLPLHRLVAETFIGPRPEGQMICHWNGDKGDNRVVNLRYDSRKENAIDSLRHGTHYPGSLTHCVKAGHPLSGANLYIFPKSGKRMCRACARARRQRQVAAA